MERVKTENDKKKEYLRRYLLAIKKENEIKEEIHLLELEYFHPPALQQDGMPHASGVSDLSGFAAKIDELMRDLKIQMEKRIKIRMEISRKIEEMSDETESLLLRYRYIQGLRWEDIAVKMEYSWQYIHKIHARALKNFKM